jgi:hypothetical protein
MDRALNYIWEQSENTCIEMEGDKGNAEDINHCLPYSFQITFRYIYFFYLFEISHFSPGITVFASGIEGRQ